MPGRSTRDDKQAAEPGTFGGLMHQFGKSLGLVKDPDPDDAAPTSTTPPKTATSSAADKLAARTTLVDKQVEEASK